MASVRAMTRIMMHVGGQNRPLSMGGDFTTLPTDGRAAWWSGLPIERHRMEPWEGDAEVGPLGGEQGVLLYASGAVEIESTSGGRDVSRRVVAGNVRVLSGGDRQRLRRITGHADVVAVHLPAEWITRALGEKGTELFARTTSLDDGDTITALAGEMLAEVNRRGVTGPLFAESLSLAFVSYLGARLGEHALAQHERGRAFSRAESERLREFISSRLCEDVSLTELASVVGLRPRHFSELFHRAFGCSPYRFVLNRRLSEAARLLATTELDVAEVAYELGFCSQSHFTAMFRRAYGVTPGQYVTQRRSAVS
jgi:AraC-like DNA-binding protein